MDIISLNINNFCGKQDWRNLVRDSKESAFKEYLPKIIDYVTDWLSRDEDNLFIAHEVPHERIKELEEALDGPGLKVLPYNEKTRKPGIRTIAIVKKENSGWQSSEVLKPCLTQWYDKGNCYNYYNRYIGVRHRQTNLSVLGVHIPMYEDYKDNRADVSYFWDSLIHTAAVYTHQKLPLILIGDFNVFSRGTVVRKKYYELQSMGAVDVWIEKGYSHTDGTFSNGNRLDYAFASEEAFSKIEGISLEKTIEREISDHDAICVSYK